MIVTLSKECKPSADGRFVILSGHQPVYIPGLILFNKIALSDAFMFVGHCQFSNKSWHSRNYIRMGDRAFLLSVPVVKSHRFGQSINDTQIVGGDWKRKHLGSIRQTYSRRPYFKHYFSELSDIMMREWSSLGEMNSALIRMMLGWFKIKTPVYDSRDYAVQGQKNDMLISMCKAMHINRYLSNEGSRDYVDELQLSDAGIAHYWQDFSHPIYDQGRAFIPNLSAIDLAFNCGEKSSEIIRKAGFVSRGGGTPLGKAGSPSRDTIL